MRPEYDLRGVMEFVPSICGQAAREAECMEKESLPIVFCYVPDTRYRVEQR